MTNLRGSDVPCNPVFLAYLLVERDSAELFVDAERLSAEAARAIADAGIATVSPLYAPRSAGGGCTPWAGDARS